MVIDSMIGHNLADSPAHTKDLNAYTIGVLRNVIKCVNSTFKDASHTRAKHNDEDMFIARFFTGQDTVHLNLLESIKQQSPKSVVVDVNVVPDLSNRKLTLDVVMLKHGGKSHTTERVTDTTMLWVTPDSTKTSLVVDGMESLHSDDAAIIPVLVNTMDCIASEDQNCLYSVKNEKKTFILYVDGMDAISLSSAHKVMFSAASRAVSIVFNASTGYPNSSTHHLYRSLLDSELAQLNLSLAIVIRKASEPIRYMTRLIEDHEELQDFPVSKRKRRGKLVTETDSEYETRSKRK